MAKIHLNRLRDKYPEAFNPGQASGFNYSQIMGEILANNAEATQRAVARIKNENLAKQASRIKRSTAKQLAVPDLAEVLPKRSVFIRKGAQNGQIISETLRDRLTADLRATVKEFMAEGKGSMQYRRGEARGQIRPELVTRMEDRLRQTFEGYTKPDAQGVPSNLRTIAETETRSAISDIKHQWAQRVQDANRGSLRMVKTWRHHPSLSERPRSGHRMLDGKTIPMDAFFRVPLLIRDKRGFRWGEIENMLHPHDPTASAGNTINCKCNCDYGIELL